MTPTVSAQAATCAESVVVTLSRLRRRMRELDPEEGLSPSQRSVLSRLSKEGDASTSELAAAERVRPQSMAATVTALLDLELVVRTDDPHDGRRRVLSLTPSGRTWVRESRAAKQGWLAGSLAEHCTESERRCVLDAMEVLDRVVHA